jgi:hypothetical protein
MIKEELYVIKPYDKGTWIVECDHNQHANIVDSEEVTCTCEDYEYRHSMYPPKKYLCKHMRIVDCAQYPSRASIVRREICTKTKYETLVLEY